MGQLRMELVWWSRRDLGQAVESGEDQDHERGRDHDPDPGRDLRDRDPEEEDPEAEIEDAAELAPEIGEDQDLEITRVRRAREIEMRGRRSEEIMIRRSRDSTPRKKRSMKQWTWRFQILHEKIFNLTIGGVSGVVQQLEPLLLGQLCLNFSISCLRLAF